MPASLVASQTIAASGAPTSIVGTSDLVTLVAAALGALVGAGVAFLLEEMRRRRAERATRYSRLLEAQIALGMQLNTLVNIQGYLDEHRAEPNRHMLLVPLHMSLTDLRVDLSALGFIADIDDVEILMRVYLAEQAYLTACTALTVSNSKIQELRYDGVLARGPVDADTGTSVGVFDPAKVVILKQLVDGMYDSVDEAIEGEGIALDDLRGVIRRRFPKKKSLVFQLPSTSGANPG